jgi:hypothetical protein
MNTTQPALTFPTHCHNIPVVQRAKRAFDLESQARLVENLIPKFKDERDRQFYTEVVQSYRAVARELRKAFA